MSSVTPAPHRTGPLPAPVRSAVRGAARAVAATVGAVLAGLVLALPAVHLPPPSVPAGLATSVVASAPSGLLAPVGTPPSPSSLLAPVAAGTVLTAAREVRAGVAGAVDVLRERLAPPVVGVVPAVGAAWTAAVALAAALVGAAPAGSRRRGPGRGTRLGPAPLRGPPRRPAPAP